MVSYPALNKTPGDEKPEILRQHSLRLCQMKPASLAKAGFDGAARLPEPVDNGHRCAAVHRQEDGATIKADVRADFDPANPMLADRNEFCTVFTPNRKTAVSHAEAVFGIQNVEHAMPLVEPGPFLFEQDHAVIRHFRFHRF
ncbi:hypothetical protein CCR90_14125 [Rhodovulum sulfidophilum]|nr:hypothetical protein [Rhodovulum sulfidophilum]MBK5924882.1 hypothetical protein [Rhodovulum sulfidophilum]